MFYTHGDQKRVGVAILISDEIDFKTNSVIKDRWAFHNDKGVNPAKIYNDYKYLCTKCRST